MKKLQIYEPAMCCNTGISGVGVDTELIRISAVLKSLMKHDIKVDRFDLSHQPQAFIDNVQINQMILNEGMDHLPAATLDGKIVVKGRYPTNEEFCQFLEIPSEYLGEQPKILNIKM